VSMAPSHPRLRGLVPDLFVLPLDDGRYLLYAPLVRAALETNTAGIALLTRIASGDHQTPATGHAAHFWTWLRQLEMLDPSAVLEPAGECTATFAPTRVTLFLTTACNLRCTYCYASAGDTPVRTMGWDVARAAMDFVQRNVVEAEAAKTELMFHGGGEPTTAWPMLTASVEYMQAFCRERHVDLSVSLSTNGVLRDAQVDYITRQCTSANVSYDGLPAVHDAQRPKVGGGGSAEDAVRTLRRFDAARFHYGVRMTVTERSVEQMVPSVEWLLAECRPAVIHLEPSFLMGRCAALNDPPPAFDTFLAGYRVCREIAGHAGVRLHYSGANLDSLTSHFCGVSQDGFAVTTEGTASACYEAFLEEDPRGQSEFFYGHLDRNTGQWVFDDDRIARLRQSTVRDKPFCQHCFVKWHCAGDCHHRAAESAQGARFQGTPRCRLNQELTKDLLLERVRAGGGAWKEESLQANHADQPPVP
jgi:uncharacterized protein